MKVSEKWLREWVNPPIGTEELAEQLTMLGLEVDDVEPAAPFFNGVLIAQVVAVKHHPNADKLKVCEVDFGGESEVEVVCGAPNVKVGLRVPFATVGAKLPNGFKIKKSKIRGVPSYGMLCSEAELALATASDGLMVLPDDAPLGFEVYDYLNLADPVLDVDLTPNRADCFSIRGVAREVGVRNRCDITLPDTSPVTPVIDDVMSVELSEGSGCSRYVGRIIRNVNASAVSPLWLKERLRRSGIRPISPAVDITNMLMLELGQPMHAFDLDKIDTSINVRKAFPSEPLTLLNGENVALNENTTVIADAQGVLAMGGVMGGQSSAVTESTQNILLEAAAFLPEHIIGKSRRYNLYTDSAHRFERGVDPDLQRDAIERATKLLTAITGGEVGPVFEVNIPQQHRISTGALLRKNRIGVVLGITFDDTDIEDVLTRLNIEWTHCNEGWRVTPPSFRYDLNIEADYIEELARVHGYDKLPRTAYEIAPTISTYKHQEKSQEELLKRLVQRGYHEVVTFSFVNHQIQEKVYPGEAVLELANPISSELSVMRVGLWPGLLETLQKNLKRQQNQIKVFEYGLKFVLQDTELKQKKVLAGLVSGWAAPEQWSQTVREVDFFDIKADVESILQLSCDAKTIFMRAEHPALHPGQSAQILAHGKSIGWIGRLHPALQESLSLSQSALMFELDAEVFGHAAVPEYGKISRFPAVRRDISVIVDESIPYQKIANCIADISPTYLGEVILFDVYEGEHIDEGAKSFALGLVFQAHDRTLTDEEVEESVELILSDLGAQLGAKLRE
ncbi:MAG: phenylalanine--tRNA ligase subunit beta [Gammaproteobacteria bacterium]|nr:phenylalanine--tRNA ligase subunit beta [Gammaproteobacteria bacterium]